MACQRRRKLGSFAGGDFLVRQEIVLRTARSNRRGRCRSSRGWKMMRRLIVTALMACLPVLCFAQVPRATDGKPDLSGVWQSGSAVKGSWEEANSGFGLGGTGTNPDVPRVPSSSEAPERNLAPYQPWATEKVREMFNRQGFDDPTARCLPAFRPVCFL